MEANRKEQCEFQRELNGEIWNFYMVWIQPNGEPAWYDAITHRNGVAFHKIFSPDEVQPPIVTYAKESDNPNRL